MTKTAPVKAFEVTNTDDRGKPGAYWFMCAWVDGTKTETRVGITHACPCGCGSWGAIWFKGLSRNGSGKSPAHEWDVVGEWPSVTLSPSIGFAKDRATGQYHWHGFLERGWFVNERGEAPQ